MIDPDIMLIYDNSFLDNNNLDNIEGENIFTDTIQNISEISKIQSGFLQGFEEEN